MSRHMIFHYPLPLNRGATAASGIRPVEMFDAFCHLGYQVDLVAGYAVDRAKSIAEIEKKIRNGVVYDFLYSECSTMPTILTEANHFPSHPLMDFQFFSHCRKEKIPIGLFYRDIYWRFQGYGQGTSFVKRFMAKACYIYDLLQYRRNVDKLFLPSMAMAKYVPIIKKNTFSALPPGHSKPVGGEYYANNTVHLLYVGGLGSHYQIHALLEAVQACRFACLTICTRKEEWEVVRHSYEPYLSENIRIVHASGDELADLYAECNVTVLYVKPQEYRQFAAPFKLYEYLGWRKPIIASDATLAGSFVSSNNVGWSIPYQAGALMGLLTALADNPHLIDEARQRVESVAPKHSWQSRADQVAQELTGL